MMTEMDLKKTGILPFTTCESQTHKLYATEINEFYITKSKILKL
jgi:hypothetical protein